MGTSDTTTSVYLHKTNNGTKLRISILPKKHEPPSELIRLPPQLPKPRQIPREQRVPQATPQRIRRRWRFLFPQDDDPVLTLADFSPPLCGLCHKPQIYLGCLPF